MSDENDATGGEQPDSASTAANVETPATEPGKGKEAPSEEGKQPDAAKDDADREASEAGKKLNQHKQTARERVQQAVARQREAERRAESLARELEAMKARLKEPAESDFEDASQLTAARVEHTLNKRDAERLEAEQRAASEQAMEAIREAWMDRVDDFKAEKPYFQEVAGSAPISERTAELIVTMEHGPAVAYWLGQNPKEAKRIDALPAREKAIALGVIEGRLTIPPPRKVTTAPEPVSSVSGRNAGSTFDPSKADMDEYIRRRKQGWGT